MKAFLAGLVFLAVVVAGGFFWLKYMYKPSTESQVYKTEAITRTGVLQKSAIAGSDFTHVIIAEGKSWGAASYSLNLDKYVGKKVEATGQNSGTTLYIDTVKELP
jgi:hypothetical protein